MVRAVATGVFAAAALGALALPRSAWGACEQERQQLGADLSEIRRIERKRLRQPGDEARRQALLDEIRDLQTKLASTACGGHPPPVSIDTRPDAILQALVCLPFNGVTTEQVTTELMKRLDDASALQPKLLPRPGVKAACDPVKGRETVGIWRADAGWVSELSSLDITSADGAIFAIQFPRYSLDRLLSDAWRELPKRYGENGKPAADGSLRLVNYDLDTSTDQEVQLVVHGKYDLTSVIGIDGDLTLIDRPAIDAEGRPECTHRVKFDPDVNRFWAGFAFMPYPFNGALFSETLARLGYAQNRIFSSSELMTNQPGCLITSLVPSEIALTRPPGKKRGERWVRPAARKVVFRYDRLRVDGSGITFATTDIQRLPHLEDRNAEARWLSGPEVRVFARDTAKRVQVRAAVELRDMRPPVHITWSVPGGRVDSTPPNDPSYALVSFPALPPNRRALGLRTPLGSITVRAVDADDLTATAAMSFTALTVGNPPPPPDPDPRKPWIDPVH